MSTILCKTKGNSNPKGKPRVYFTCHPEDFEKCFDKICSDIFASHDCAIYYTKDMTEIIDEKNKATDLESNNLFVIPVTYKLLSTPNRAMDMDFPYAREKNIPVLPIIIEPGLDEIYSRKDKFGEMQYLNPFSTDMTAISYNDKLKKYLNIVLINDETAKRVRSAFDAYIFLSYRKKDRHLANQLMKMIHANPEYRDIAIWFDEFLTPGESFRESINKVLSDSKLFTLLVTPSILEENNFVMMEEYPAARASGIEILPAEMEKTDREKLCEKYESIPECADTSDQAAFRNRLLEEVAKLAISENNTPEHNFLIGLAYLDGIDVEVNRERGLELMIGAAENGLVEAMEKLYNIYENGIYVKLDYNKALYWSKKIADYYTQKYGENHIKSIDAFYRLSISYYYIKDYKNSIALSKKVYKSRCKILGKTHRDSITSLNDIAVLYGKTGEHKKEMELIKKAYILSREKLGEHHINTIESLNNLALAYGNIKDYTTQLELLNKVYFLSSTYLGEEHIYTIWSLHNLADAYNDIKNYSKCLELDEKAYTLIRKVLGEEHPDTIFLLNELASAYGDAEFYDEELKLYKRAYYISCKVFGKEHPDTIKICNKLKWLINDYNDCVNLLETAKNEYENCCKIHGNQHSDTIIALNNLAHAYSKTGDNITAIELYENAHALYCQTLGEEYLGSIFVLDNLGAVYSEIGEYSKALEICERVYHFYCKAFGEEHPDTIESIYNLGYTYGESGDYLKSIELYEKVCDHYYNIFDEKYLSNIFTTLNNLAYSYNKTENYSKALEICEELYLLQYKFLGIDHPDTIKTEMKMEELKNKE